MALKRFVCVCVQEWNIYFYMKTHFIILKVCSLAFVKYKETFTFIVVALS